MLNEIKEIKISNSGYVLCKSSFYEIFITLNENNQCVFNEGLNLLKCEIDSPEVAFCYLLSAKNKSKKSMLFLEECVYVNGSKVSLKEFLKHSCYIDETNPLFSKKYSVRALIERGLKSSKIKSNVEQIADMFQLTNRIEKTIKANGSEKYRAMSAVAFAYGKEIFCFPWFSKRQIEYYKETIRFLHDILPRHKKVVLFPETTKTEDDYLSPFRKV